MRENNDNNNNTTTKKTRRVTGVRERRQEGVREGGREDEFNLDGGINRNVFPNLVREKWMWEGVIYGEDVRGGERGGKRG